MPRMPRPLSSDRPAHYLVSNRLAGGSRARALAQPWARQEFLRQLALCTAGYTIRVLSYQVLADGFRLTLQVDSPAGLSDEEVERRIAQLGRQTRVRELDDDARQAARHRLDSLPAFMRDLQSGWTREYNRRYRRRGPMWAGRYRSVELGGEAAVAAANQFVGQAATPEPKTGAGEGHNLAAAGPPGPRPDPPDGRGPDKGERLPLDGNPWSPQEVQALRRLWPRRLWRQTVPVWEWGRAVGEREFVQRCADRDRPYCRWEVAPLGIRNLWSLRPPEPAARKTAIPLPWLQGSVRPVVDLIPP
ncbi:MAG: hypothetical protein Kow001_17420 [Acidobacteriota bacterium]